LEEMPGDEGYPAYLGSRTAQFYERAGLATLLGSDGKLGSLTAIGAVSPPGGDLSEPVTQNTLRVVKVFWGLDEKLAYSRHYPAINWLTSYTLYFDQLKEYFGEQAGKNWSGNREEAMNILQEEANLEEVVRLVGLEALSKPEQLLLHVARSLREDYLQQNAFDDVDTYTSLHKQYRMLEIILTAYRAARERLQQVNFAMADLLQLAVWAELARLKYVPEEEFDTTADALLQNISSSIRQLAVEGEAVVS